MWAYLRGGNASAMVISAAVHGLALLAFSFYKFTAHIISPDNVVVETVLADERNQQEFDQDLNLDTRVSENLSMQSGGMVSTGIGGMAGSGTATMAQAKIGESEIMKGASDLRVVSIGDISIPGVGEMNLDLGEGQVKGEAGSRVEGYGAAMGVVTKEILRMMRKEPIIAVWLFDASASLADDRKEISENVEKIYKELKIASDEAKTRNMKFSPLETMICSLGSEKKNLLPAPTSDLEAIRKAIASIPNDDSGEEKTYFAISKAIDEFAPLAARSNRKLALFVVTDETGDDDNQLEEVITKTDKFKVPVYFMGREAIFGSPNAHILWVDPKTSVRHHIRVHRGPETPFPECLQFDGLHGRWDSHSSGFGSYGQVRLAKQSGGIFFLLGGQEASLIGAGARDSRKFDDLAMKEYEPQLLGRRDYEQARNKSEFRSGIWQVINALDPAQDNQMNLKVERFPLDPIEFQKDRDLYFGRCLRDLTKVNEAIKRMEQIEKLREKENEPRWRAAYDLAYAQLLAFRVREFQYLLIMDQHAKDKPQVKDSKSNEWYFSYTQKLLEPTPEQVRATKVDMKELEAQKTLAIKLLDQVIKTNPGTPWERVARLEKGNGFGLELRERYRDPREYEGKDVPKF
ncbi:VWA domain-containing protein [Planctomicrobium piriforme]|uniref:VWFA domain-containing protein n=1 Tax=Planctomicrobium piriforme TaxID=1576369 RepID=A0A1I3DL24_9PLAN|nr:VWA domain-containing protein [Planctomicrobium piriforme]SFH87191.1 hypothetical protein SAMN05421753_103293 [Planctomicrobium piriforme]